MKLVEVYKTCCTNVVVCSHCTCPYTTFCRMYYSYAYFVSFILHIFVPNIMYCNSFYQNFVVNGGQYVM